MLRIQNQSASPFKGWKRVTVSKWPAHDAGTVAGHDFVLGRMVGIAARTCDVRVSLQPGQGVTLDIMSSTPRPYSIHEHVPSQATADPVGFFGIPHVLGTPLEFVSMKEDGACFLIHLRGRAHVAPMLVSDLFVHWYPDQSWAPAVLSVTASNPAMPDMIAVLPRDLTLQIAGAFVRSAQHELPEFELMNSGDFFGDGQTRAWPLTIEWTRGQGESLESAIAHANLKIVGRGLDRIGPLGLIPDQGRFDPRAWMQTYRQRAIDSLYDWPATMLGVTANAGNTGDQEDQGFSQGFECFYPGGLGAEAATYCTALAQMKRPCHHRERNGALLDIDRHKDSRLVLWAGRPHWHKSVSPDQLGKPRNITLAETHGWYGPDDEHWLMNRVAAAYELTACPVLQQELETQARNLLFSETLDRSLTTTSPRAARARGWLGLVVSHLWKLLDDRTLANRVKERWIALVDQILVPAWSGKKFLEQPQTAPDLRLASVLDEAQYPRCGRIYHSAIAAYGLYLAGKVLGHEPSRALGVGCALDVATFGYTRHSDGRWIAWDLVGLDAAGNVPATPYVEGVSAHRTGWFDYAWTPFALWVCMDSGAATAPIREAWAQAVEGARKATDQGKTYSTTVQDWTPPLEPATS